MTPTWTLPRTDDCKSLKYSNEKDEQQPECLQMNEPTPGITTGLHNASSNAQDFMAQTGGQGIFLFYIFRLYVPPAMRKLSGLYYKHFHSVQKWGTGRFSQREVNSDVQPRSQIASWSVSQLESLSTSHPPYLKRSEFKHKLVLFRFRTQRMAATVRNLKWKGWFPPT